MAIIKEVKLIKDGAMVTPKVILDSVRLLDGTKLIDRLRTSLERLPPTELTSINELTGSYNYSLSYGNGVYVIGSVGKILSSNDLENWTVTENVLTSGGSNQQVLGIAYGSNRFVAVGGNGTMAHSTDGVNWTPISQSVITGSLCSIAYGADKFVVGNTSGKMAYSTDGVNWTAISTSVTCANHIAYGNGVFIVATNSYDIYRSTDGVSWTKISISSLALSGLSNIAYGNGRWVGVAHISSQLTTTQVVAYSTDNGDTWTCDTDSTPFSTTPKKLCYGNGNFLVVCANGYAYYSPNGENWIRCKVVDNVSPTQATIYDCIYANGRFLACNKELLCSRVNL